MKKYTCQCCGYMTLDEKPGDYDICPICFWEDDGLQNEQYDMDGGANDVSLRQAQKNFIKFGANSKTNLKDVRKPTKLDKKDPNWKPINDDAPNSEDHWEAGIKKLKRQKHKK